MKAHHTFMERFDQYRFAMPEDNSETTNSKLTPELTAVMQDRKKPLYLREAGSIVEAGFRNNEVYKVSEQQPVVKLREQDKPERRKYKTD